MLQVVLIGAQCLNTDSRMIKGSIIKYSPLVMHSRAIFCSFKSSRFLPSHFPTELILLTSLQPMQCHVYYLLLVSLYDQNLRILLY